MAKYSYGQLEQLWISNGGPAAVANIAAAIALAESRGESTAENRVDNNGTQTSWGLWQISNGTHNMPTPNILDPNVNARAAVAKYRASGWSPWGTFQTGAYKQFLQSGVPPTPAGAPPNATLLSATSPAGGGGGAPSTSGNPFSVWQLLGIPDPVDALERLGLILLGTLLILVGIYLLAGRQGFKLVTKGVVQGDDKSEERRAREAAAEARRTRREIRQGEAGQRQNRALGLRERRVRLAEDIERRKRGELTR